MRLLLVSTHSKDEFETLSAADYFARHPYSVGAMLCNLAEVQAAP